MPMIIAATIASMGATAIGKDPIIKTSKIFYYNIGRKLPKIHKLQEQFHNVICADTERLVKILALFRESEILVDGKHTNISASEALVLSQMPAKILRGSRGAHTLL